MKTEKAINQESKQKLVDKKINPTAMRLLVLDLLLQQNSAISLSDIEKNLEPADRTTIYRTLKTFEEKGLTHAIDVAPERPNTPYAWRNVMIMNTMICMFTFIVTPAKKHPASPIVKSPMYHYPIISLL